MKNFKFNREKYISDLILCSLLVAFIAGIFLYFVFSQQIDTTLMMVVLLFGLVICIFMVFPVHCMITQYKYEQDVCFVVDENTKQCIYSKGKKHIQFEIDDIKCCYARAMRRSIAGGYAEIALKSGKSIYLSSYMFDGSYFQKWNIETVAEGTFDMSFPLDTQEYWAVGIKDSDVA